MVFWPSAMPLLAPERKPDWLKVPAPGGERHAGLKRLLRERGLHTVCEEARCPNVGECWASGTATIMLLGDTCTRGCRFCAVATGNPRGKVDADEPARTAGAVAALGLDYLVITTVDRDDLPDGGAAHLAATLRRVREASPRTRLEFLVGDFQGRRRSLETLLAASPDVFAHNVETVERLTPGVRDRRASYRQSLDVLRASREIAPGVPTKSSLMLGLGETGEEIRTTLRDLRGAGVDFLTLGQYLRPTPRHLGVARYAAPAEFEAWRTEALSLGFRHVASGPLVRSSYKAAEIAIRDLLEGRP